MNLHDRILGSLTAAAIGDAMGAPLETRPTELIRQDYGSGDFVYDYLTPKADAPSAGMDRGMVTDDFSLSFASAKAFLAHGGISHESAMEGLLNWRNMDIYKRYSDVYMGSTTRIAIEKLEGTHVKRLFENLECHQATITDGAAMKSWVCGLFHPGNVEKAIDDAIVMGMTTHNNVLALTGAAAVAAATAAALISNQSADAVIRGAAYGAQEGYQRALQVAIDSAGANIEKRIQFAVQIGLRHSNNFERCIDDMSNLIGTGRLVTEAVPSAIGFFASTGGSVLPTIYRAINAGNDCDTVATIAGAIAGAFSGFTEELEPHLNFLSETNQFDIRALADEICTFVS